ncbi:hypothetical protein [Thermovibrio ammonificans]|nr:hypothetical protein [Thermovibrio ammonificans]
MSNQKVESLEALISKISYEIVSEGILEETEINKLLGVLANNGVYAMWVWARSRKDINDHALFNELMRVMKFVKEKSEEESFENYFQSISEDLHKLLFIKQLLEKTLIYARYHAKSLGD